MNIFPERAVLIHIPHPPIIKTLLPNLAPKAQFLSSPKREAALDQLQRSLQSFGRAKEHMKVIRHQHKLM
jgi:hypothetical protein